MKILFRQDTHIKNNAFAYVTQKNEVTAVNRVTSVTFENFTSNLHFVNKKAYTFNIVKTNENDFSSRLKLNKAPLTEGEYTGCIEFFYPQTENDQNWSLFPLNKFAGNTITYHVKRFNTHDPPYIRIIFNTYKNEGENDDTIYFDISNPGYNNAKQNEKAALTVYGIKGFQTNIEGAVYDQSFYIDGGDFTLQTNLDMNGFEIKNYQSQRLIVISGDYKKEYVQLKKFGIVKFGNVFYTMAPLPCIIKRVTIFIASLGDENKYEKIDLRLRLETTTWTFAGKNITNNNFQYQYMEPVLNDGEKIQVPRGSNPSIFMQLLKHNSPLSVKYAEVLVSLILEVI